jgi:hypothetical protein
MKEYYYISYSINYRGAKSGDDHEKRWNEYVNTKKQMNF